MGPYFQVVPGETKKRMKDLLTLQIDLTLFGRQNSTIKLPLSLLFEV